MMWFLFKLKSTNTVIVHAKDREAAKTKFKEVWPNEKCKIAECGDDMNDEPLGAIETLLAA